MKSPIQITPIDNGWIVAWQNPSEQSNIHPAAMAQQQVQPKQNAVFCADHDAICKCLQDVLTD